ncbi:hypothetical protein GW796_06445 [archaeon]|nr:hypothetical protein [archaeon]
MSKSLHVDILYGFETNINLTDEEVREMKKLDILTSPICYYTGDHEQHNNFIGKSLQSLDSVGKYAIISELSIEAKKELKSRLLSDLSELGYDVVDKGFNVIINSYYH